MAMATQERKDGASLPPAAEMMGVSLAFRRGRETIIVLEDISLRLRYRDFVCVLGPSGCGKTS
ncbi:MAG: ABC transporter ATP-binding protein, partial [Deltaproteobacteria bacterium]|nr:ABC transporter ATP-binding protein [Deltaproteobacteria bacterium]